METLPLSDFPETQRDRADLTHLSADDVLARVQAGALALLDPWLGRAFLAENLERFVDEGQDAMAPGPALEPIENPTAAETERQRLVQGTVRLDWKRVKSAKHASISFAALDALLVSGALRIDRSIGSVFVCVDADSPEQRHARTNSVVGLPSRYQNSVGPAAAEAIAKLDRRTRAGRR